MNDALYILTSFDFNKAAGAAWSRVNNYAECLKNTGTSVYIASSVYNLAKGTYILQTGESIFQVRTDRVEKYRKSYIQQFRFLYYYKHYLSILQISKNQESNKNIFFLYSFNLSSVAMALLVFRILNRQIIYCEKNELQLGIAFNQPLPKNVFRYLPALLLKMLTSIAGFLQDLMTIHFNGIIVISQRFMRIYSKTNKKIILIPILANNKFFRYNRKVKKTDNFKICYTGDINQNKDGVLDLLNALSLIRSRQLSCDFYGNVNIEFRTQLDDKLKELGTFHSIKIHDQKPHDQVAEILSGYDLLILPRPRNLQTIFGFSTKLAEYLASSVPVLASRISDNDLYIEDVKNGFLYEPGDIEQLQKKIEEIINTENDKLITIGLAGRTTAQEHFTISRYSSLLKSFLFN
jgi:glycosyltransferase involved in cell wall biosynthesis